MRRNTESCTGSRGGNTVAGVLDNPFFYLFVAGCFTGVLLGLGGFRLRRARRPLRYRSQRRFLVPAILVVLVAIAGGFFFADITLVSIYWRWGIALAVFPMVVVWVFLLLPRRWWSWGVRVLLLTLVLLPAASGWLWRSGHDPLRGTVTFRLDMPDERTEVVLGGHDSPGDALRFLTVPGNPSSEQQLIPRDAVIMVYAQVQERIPPLWWWYPPRQLISLGLEHSEVLILAQERESPPAFLAALIDRFSLVGENEVTARLPEQSEEWLQPGAYQITWDSQRNTLSGRYTGR